VLDQLRTWHGSHDRPVQLGEVEEYIVAVSKEFGHCRLLYDPHQAAGTAQNLRSRGVIADPFLFTTFSVGRLGLGLSQAIRNQRLAIWHDAALIKELLSVQLKETGPGQFRLTHPASGHDDMAVTLAMAVVTLLESNTTSPGEERLEQLGRAAEQAKPSGWSPFSPMPRLCRRLPARHSYWTSYGSKTNGITGASRFNVAPTDVSDSLSS